VHQVHAEEQERAVEVMQSHGKVNQTDQWQTNDKLMTTTTDQLSDHPVTTGDWPSRDQNNFLLFTSDTLFSFCL